LKVNEMRELSADELGQVEGGSWWVPVVIGAGAVLATYGVFRWVVPGAFQQTLQLDPYPSATPTPTPTSSYYNYNDYGGYDSYDSYDSYSYDSGGDYWA
jgi:hypothetical protein